MDDDLAYATLAELRDRAVTSVELVEALLERIAAIDAPGTAVELRSVLATSGGALDEARRADTAGAGGPLQGIPVLVKDNIEVAGLPSCAGATSLLDRPARRDAPLVARLRQAGAVIVGTTNLSEWANIRSARSSGGWSAVGGLTRSPWALDRNAGGSSSGSGAALAAGLAPLAIGTETDGSITCPSSLNGVTGIKPAVGAVPTAGVVPVSASQDSPGPMARCAEDTAALLEVLTGRHGVADRARAGVRGVRVGAATTWRTGHPATDEAFEAAVDRLRRAGAEVKPLAVALPPPEVEADELTVLLCELVDGLARYLPTRGPGGPQDLAQVVAHERAHAEVELAHFGHDLFEQALALGGSASPQYASARARNRTWALDVCLDPATADVDLVVGPTYGPAWKSDLLLGGHPALSSAITTAPSIAGWPIACAPMGLVGGLPVGLGAVGPPGSEGVLLAVCAAVEQRHRPAFRQPVSG